MWQAWVNLVIGLWLILSGFIPELDTPSLMLISGFIVFLSGFSAAISSKSWEGILNSLIGVWLILCSIWFNFFMPWNFFVTGGVIFVFAVWNINEHPRSKVSPGSLP